MRDQPPELRGLKALVVILGTLIVLGTALVVGVVIQRIYAKPAVPSMMAMPGRAAPTTVLPAGDHVAGIAAAGSAVAVWVTGPDGDEVLLVDSGSGAARVAVAGQR